MQSKRQATLLLCLVLAALVSTTLARLEERKCVEGKSYNDGCNECRCLGGRRACTLMACNELDPATQTYVPKPTIPPPSDFYVPISDAPLPKP